ncbi:conserved hypothetical protein [Leishmania braziliensis MHOM/BR/75/M2904]|uniref:Uncharacterized protein n=2 Tax=Leishmania braziliensis TaxID=5660 RepID=A4H9A0_LEIBR|nr:conserved hypothetical protein [Leishmania braziliensis MHOM/BR/75/M2904]KAI5687313.1 hypothetical protein MNV84_02465 [Leishmania braziliensis]CAJ2470185.1 unnamed protein product [Leishmania braziliensis]CAJ2470680.1 unnamed protein product [Leishmania braziliensis]CAM37970.1 conserved hypothetical protein [Leishmania braziliensis MHOM/BR/75/M2904]SYZ64625.1 hypothetical_protein [Leishmania braziliensis MHOM/BR/75/M2904]
MAATENKGIAELYQQLLQDGVQLQKELEAYYLRQEGYIRKRVAVLDEMQENIADERRCLEIQHQECRAQISAARRQAANFVSNERKVSQAVQHAQPSLAAQEAEIDKRLEELQREKDKEDAALLSVMARQEALGKQEALLTSRERQKFLEEQDLQKALSEMRSLNREMEERRKSLLRKRDTVAEWDRKLESRERELLGCQDQLRESLKALEKEENALGIHPAQRTAVTPAVSQRTVMDDHDMSIDHDSACEEIDYED